MKNINPIWLTVVGIVITNFLSNLVTHYAIFKGISQADISVLATVLASALIAAVYAGLTLLAVWWHHKVQGIVVANANIGGGCPAPPPPQPDKK